jgi:outer membrane biosynthesis protein TonB
VTVVESTEQKPQPTVPPPSMTKPAPKPVTEPAKLPAVKTEPPPQPAPVAAPKLAPAPAPEPAPGPPPKLVETPKPPPAPAVQPEPSIAAPAPSKIVLISPIDGSVGQRAILVRGTADPGSVVKVTITYSNQLSGVLKLAGEVLSQNAAVDERGEFRVGPIALSGPLATNGLKFTVKAYYPDRADHGTALASVVGR